MSNEVLEGKMRVAEFMGHKNVMIHTGKVYAKPDDTHQVKYGHYQVPAYDSEWSDLMPVVEKIGNIPSFSIEIELFTVEHGSRNVCSCGIEKTVWVSGKPEKQNIAYLKEFTGKIPAIENVFGRVVQFINFYNLNKSK